MVSLHLAICFSKRILQRLELHENLALKMMISGDSLMILARNDHFLALILPNGGFVEHLRF